MHRRSILILLVILMVIALPAISAAPAVAGQVAYPALGNIDFEKGTLEMWLVPQFDTAAEVEGGLWNRVILTVTPEPSPSLFPDEDVFQLTWRVRQTEAHGRLAGPLPRGRRGGEETFRQWLLWHWIGRDDDGWDQGQARHIAYSWDGDELWVRVDGEEIKRQTLLSPLSAPPTEHMQIVLGHPGDSPFVIRDLRISSIVREPEELGYHHRDGLEADPWTLLLDPLDQVTETDDGRRTRPRLMAPGPGHEAGVIEGPAELTETEIGTGLGL